jgi:hypothetical protein
VVSYIGPLSFALESIILLTVRAALRHPTSQLSASLISHLTCSPASHHPHVVPSHQPCTTISPHLPSRAIPHLIASHQPHDVPPPQVVSTIARSRQSIGDYRHVATGIGERQRSLEQLYHEAANAAEGSLSLKERVRGTSHIPTPWTHPMDPPHTPPHAPTRRLSSPLRCAERPTAVRSRRRPVFAAREIKDNESGNKTGIFKSGRLDFLASGMGHHSGIGTPDLT